MTQSCSIHRRDCAPAGGVVRAEYGADREKIRAGEVPAAVREIMGYVTIAFTVPKGAKVAAFSASGTPAPRDSDSRAKRTGAKLAATPTTTTTTTTKWTNAIGSAIVRREHET